MRPPQPGQRLPSRLLRPLLLLLVIADPYASASTEVINTSSSLSATLASSQRRPHIPSTRDCASGTAGASPRPSSSADWKPDSDLQDQHPELRKPEQPQQPQQQPQQQSRQQSRQWQRQHKPAPEWQGPRCVGSAGRPVDWWALLKYPSGQTAALLESDSLPAPSTSSSPPPAGGPGGGRGGGDKDVCWRTGFDVNDPDGPLRRTLAAAAATAAAADADPASNSSGSGSSGGGGHSIVAPLSQPPSQPLPSPPADTPLGYVFYNDADPEGVEHWGFAHSKGLLLFGPSGGVWLTHSFPSFPAHPPRGVPAVTAAATAAHSAAPAADPWDVVRHAQTVYGQHALCLTLLREDLLRVVEGLLVAEAYVYDHIMPYNLVDEYSAVQELIDASSGSPDAAVATAAGADTKAGGGAADGGVKDDDGKASPHAAGAGVDGGASLRRLMSGLQRPAPFPTPPPPPPSLHRNVSQQSLATRGGSAWLYVTKSPNLSVPFHEEVLEPLLDSGMAWETWRIGTSYDSECPPQTQYDTLNVRRVVVPGCPAASAAVNASPGSVAAAVSGSGKADGSSGAVEASDRGGTGEAIGWDSLKDHSKWGISTGGLMPQVVNDGYNGSRAQRPYSHRVTQHVVCLGDLNRQPSQRFRGGGYVCSSDPWVWRAFRGLVTEVEPCAIVTW